jgi:hypothetical protein
VAARNAPAADRTVLAEHTGLTAERFTTRLRGLAQEQRLVRLTVAATRTELG